MTCAPVLRERSIVAGSTIPAPSRPLGASPVPMTVSVPGVRPSAAASALTSPAMALDGFTGGSRMLGVSAASRSADDQLRQRASKRSVADPSPGSVAVTPVMRRRISSFGERIRFVRHQTDDFSSCIQTAVAAMNPGTSGLPAISINRSAPTLAVTAAACWTDR
jgi:hypothetical protein